MFSCILGLWSFMKCTAWDSFHGTDFKLNQRLVAHFYKFCTTIVQTHLTERKDYRLSAVWLGGYPDFSSHSFLLPKTLNHLPNIPQFLLSLLDFSSFTTHMIPPTCYIASSNVNHQTHDCSEQTELLWVHFHNGNDFSCPLSIYHEIYVSPKPLFSWHKNCY